MPSLDLLYDVGYSGYAPSITAKLFLEADYSAVLKSSWNTDKVDPSIFKEKYDIEYFETNDKGTTLNYVMGNFNGVLINLSANRGYINVAVGGDSIDKCEEALAKLKELLPEKESTVDTVPFNFWAKTANGIRQFARNLEVPYWKDIDENYSAGVEVQVAEMMAWKKPPEGGKLILLTGSPGTGKTYSIRALSREWQEWCSFHYITDPETFFGQSDYMLHVLLDSDDDLEEDEGGSTNKWKILLLEDCGELLGKTAKQEVGQGLSRLLNVVDGLIGQGLKILILVTTNEEIGKLDEAVSRPGRCLRQIEFKPFTQREARTWLSTHGVKDDSDNLPIHVADLYARLDGRKLSRRESTAKVGFGLKA